MLMSAKGGIARAAPALAGPTRNGHEALLAGTDGGTYSAAKKVTMSRASSSGSSTGAKWPPLGIGVHWRTL